MNTIFWNVDTQYDFMKANGKLYVKYAEEIEKNLEELTKYAEKNNIKVINTADWHNPDSEELSDNPDYMNTFPQHCMKDSLGAKYIMETNPKNPYIISWEQKDFDEKEVARRRNIVLYKDKFDVFRGTPHADKVLDIIKPDRAIVYGVASNVCVDCAVRGLLERKIEVYVSLDAIKELPGLPLPYENWRGAKFTSTREILEGEL